MATTRRPQRKMAEQARKRIAEDAKRYQSKVFLDVKVIKIEELKHHWQNAYPEMLNGMKSVRAREAFLKQYARDAPIVNKQVFIDILAERLPHRFCRYDPEKFDDDEDAEDSDYTEGGGAADDDEDDDDDDNDDDDDDDDDEPEELPEGENKRDASGYERDGFVISDEDKNTEENRNARKEMDAILGKMNEETEKRRAERIRMAAELGDYDDGEDGEDIWAHVSDDNDRAKKRQRHS